MRARKSPVGQRGRPHDQRVSHFRTRALTKRTLPLHSDLHSLCDCAAVIAGGRESSATISTTSASSMICLLVTFGMRWREIQVDRDKSAG